MKHSVRAQAKTMEKARPDIRPGYTVRVHQKVQEGDKQRVQIFEGLIIGMHKGHTPMDVSFTVRRIASGIGVERVFPLHSPLIEKIEVKKIAKVRRSKLNFLRGRQGKNARLSERFTSSDEFSIAAAPATESEVKTDVSDTPAETAPTAETSET